MKGLCRFVALFDVGPGAVILPRSEAKLTWRGHRECAAATSSRLAYRQRPAQQVWQLGDVGGDAPGLVAGATVILWGPAVALLLLLAVAHFLG